MSDVISRAVIAVEATQLSGDDRNRTQSISDLMAWCGDGELTPHELHAYLRPDTSKAGIRATALLFCGSSGRRYLATACRILSVPSAAEDSSQDLMEPDHESGSSGAEARPAHGMTEISFNQAALPAALRKGLFPATYLPRIDLSLIWLDQANAALCDALEKIGFVFVGIENIGDEPSADGAEIHVVRPSASAAKGNVRGLSEALSFFWIDGSVPADTAGAPVVEGETVVGFTTGLSPSVATITKAGNLKDLVAAHGDVAPWRPALA